MNANQRLAEAKKYLAFKEEYYSHIRMPWIAEECRGAYDTISDGKELTVSLKTTFAAMLLNTIRDMTENPVSGGDIHLLSIYCQLYEYYLHGSEY